MTPEDVAATVQEFGNELLFAVLGLGSEPRGTTAVFNVALMGRTHSVTVSPATSATKPVISRPTEPTGRNRLWYRGWECAYDETAAGWCMEGWYACLGGEDLDCIVVRGRTWAELLDEIDDHDKTEKMA